MDIGDRICEVPWTYKALNDFNYGGSILDIGSAGTDLDEIVRQKRQLTRIDPMPIGDDGYSRMIIQQDIRSVFPYTNLYTREGKLEQVGLFDTILLCSSLEHMSLEGYNSKKDADDPVAEQQKILAHCIQFLKEGCHAIVTIPCGKFEHGGWYMMYSESMLNDLMRPYNIVRNHFFTLDKETWTFNHVERHNVQWDKQSDWVRTDFARASNIACYVLRK